MVESSIALRRKKRRPRAPLRSCAALLPSLTFVRMNRSAFAETNLSFLFSICQFLLSSF
jgi:hypothetical protein